MVQEDYGRLFGSCAYQQQAEIGVGRNDDPVFVCGPRKDRCVSGSLKTTIPYVNRIMARLPQHLGQVGRDGIVHEESHALLSGRARSLTASAA